MSLHIDSDGIELRSYLALPAEPAPNGNSGLVLCHGFPVAPREAMSAGLRYAELADRIADQIGVAVLTFNFRGTGQSEGDFSLGGWVSDLRAAIDHLQNTAEVESVWLAGFGTGGSVALYVAATTPGIRGVASFSARAHFDDWAGSADEVLEHARFLGTIRTPQFPADPEVWKAELLAIRPLDVVGQIPPRPILLVHGADDERVPVTDARELAAATGGAADLRIIAGASHRLRHDPRIVALLLGWLDQQV